MTQIGLMRNAELLREFFGEWPSLHDAEVESLLLERGAAAGPTLQVAVHVFQWGPDVDEDGHYVLHRQALVKFRFEGVVLERLEDFNQQNVLWDVSIGSVEPNTTDGARLAVEFTSSYGLEAAFFCVKAEVSAVIPERVAAGRGGSGGAD